MASDGLSCIHHRVAAETSVARMLFRIEPARKYNSSSRQDSQGDKLETRLREAEDEERLYQEGLKNSLNTPVYYGQTVILRHVFSGHFITLSPSKLARQVGSVAVGLYPSDSEFSSLKVLPSSRVKKLGDIVSYSDSIVIASAKEDHYFLHVSEYLGYHGRGLELNGSETRTEWKPKLYSSDSREASFFSKQSVVSPGSCLLIFNRHIGGYLASSPRELGQLQVKKKVKTTGGGAAQYLRPEPMNCLHLQPVSDLQHQVCVEIRSTPSFFALWEVQRVQLFDPSAILYYRPGGVSGGSKEATEARAAVRLKNVASQQFLATDPSDDDKLILTPSGHTEECIFYFESKLGATDASVVSTEDLLRLRNYKKRCVFPAKKSIESRSQAKRWEVQREFKGNSQWLSATENEADYEFRLSDKVDSNSSTFDLVSRPRDITLAAHQLSLLFSSLAHFHEYMQDWGLEPPPKSNEQKNGVLKFNYDQAFESEKELEIEVQEVTKALEMLYQYLSAEVSLRGDLAKYSELRSVKHSLLESETIDNDTKKKLLVEQNIIDILYFLAELIVFKTIDLLRVLKLEHVDVGEGSKTKEDRDTFRGKAGQKPGQNRNDPNQSLLSMHLLSKVKKEKVEPFENLPQTIAEKKLLKPLLLVFKIMHLAVWDNEDCSNYLALRFGFFQRIIDFYPNEAMDVMREVAKNITNQDETYLRFYEPWIEMLEDISAKQGNIKKQIFLLDTLSGLILDESTNEPIDVFQTRIFNYLFDKTAGKKNGFLRFALGGSSGAPDEEDNRFQVIFLSSGSGNRGSSTAFKEQNPALANYFSGNTNHAGIQVAVKLISLSRQDTELEDYIYYIAGYIKLLTNLCKGRKEEHIKEVTLA